VPKEKELLQILAAIGREFPLSLARHLTNWSDAELDGMLARLQSSEFIYEQPAPDDVEYTFKHALTQEVAYNSLLIERRKLLHERIGQAMESLFAERVDDHLKKIAHHYRRSGNNAKAIEYLRRAGEQTAARAFYDEAVEQLNSALELEWGPPGTWEVLSPPSMNPVLGNPVNNPWPAAIAPCVCGNEAQGAAAVPRSEGNEATREGQQEVGVLHNTYEVGEPTRGTPWREGSTGTRARSRERWRRHGAPQPYQRNSSA